MPLPPRPRPHVIYRRARAGPRPGRSRSYRVPAQAAGPRARAAAPPGPRPPHNRRTSRRASPHASPRASSRAPPGSAPPRSPKKNRKGTGKGGHANATGRRPDAIGIGRCGRDAGRSGPDGTTARRGADNPGVTGHHPIDGSMHGRAGVPWSDCAIVRPAPPGEPARAREGPEAISTTRARGRPLVFIYHQVCARSVRNKNSTQPAATHWCRLDARAPAFVKPSCSSDPPRTATTPAPTPRRHPTC